MKNVKLLWVFLFTFSAFGGFAQNHQVEKDPEQRLEKRLDFLVKELNLSPAQLSQVRNLELEIIEQRKQEKEAIKAERQGKFEQVKSQLATVLSDNQMQLLEEMHAEQMQSDAHKRKHKRHKKGSKNSQHELRFEKLSTALELTDEQKPLVKAILKDAKKDRKDKKQEMCQRKKQAKESKMEAMKQILTEEQFAKFESLKEEGKGKEHRRRKQ